VKRRSFALPTLLALGLCAGASSCLATSDEVDTLRSVDDLVGRVELLHFEAELAKARSENALDSLQGLASGGFRGDPVEAFEQLVGAIKLSEKQAESLKDCVEPMHKTAEKVFAQWAEDSAALRIDSLRARSATRMAETRARYHEILTALNGAVQAYDAFNVGLRDHATYLEHDFNPASVAAIQPELLSLARWCDEVELRLDACMDAAARYVSASALPGTVEVAQAPQGN
jgi:ElaB/YqjD/DUF883 family membrane-anchored ribosome-binding protein